MSTMQSPKPPQIIVIPSSLLQQKLAPIRISPSQNTTSPFRIVTSSPQTLNKAIISPNSVSSQMTLNRAVLSPTFTLQQRKIQPIITKPIAAVVGSKRPAPVPSPEFDNDIKYEEESDVEGGPVRKRANLDHLSPEERLMRRKLKNRVAAQTARDKKKAQTDDMEKLISDMHEEKDRLEQENNRLQATNTQLQIENANLQQDNQQLRSTMNQQGITKTEYLEIQLPPSPVSLPPPSPQRRISSPILGHSRALSVPVCSPALQPPESAALTYDPQQQEQGCRCRNSQGSSSLTLSPPPGLSSKDSTPWEGPRKGRGDCLTVILCALWCLVRTNLSSTSPLPLILSSATPLPPKKRAMIHRLSWIQPNVSLTPQPPE